MAKVSVTSGNVTVEGENQKEVFATLAEYQEIFSITQCPHCKGVNLRYAVREVDDNNFYELRCQGCFAKLQFGQHKGQLTLFPKQWVRWDPVKKVEEVL
jgi:rRNA maturation endonuclease Nob1